MSWLDSYSDWATQCTDAPAVFHKWGAYMALSSALGSRLTFKFGPFNIAPNLYVLLLAPSSIFRKSTALNLSSRIAGKVGAYELAVNGSLEGFLQDLRAHPQGTLYYSELSRLLAQFGREYATALRPLLTDLYDAPQTYRRRLRACQLNVTQPCISIFAASVLDWVLARIKQSDFAGGFLTRFIIVSAAAKEKTMAIPPPPDLAAENRLVAGLREIVNFASGEVGLNPVRREYAAWAAGFEKRARSPLLAAFISRLQISCLKLAVLEQVAESADAVLTTAALDRAAANIETVADAVADLEQTELGYGSDRGGQDQRLVARIVRIAGSIGMSELLRRSRLTSRRVNTALATLSERGDVSTMSQPRKGRPLRVITWRANGNG